MVTRAGGYCGAAFNGNRGATQEDPLSPTTFNLMVDMVVRHWLDVTVEGAEDLGQEGRHQNAQ